MLPGDLPRASALLALAYRDNPLTVALFGDDMDVRIRTNEVVFGARIASMDPAPLVVREGGEVVGVCGFDPPGGSRMTQADAVKVMEAFAAIGPDAPRRMMQMLAGWRTRAPAEPHWNLGPVGVDPAHQGMGVGSALVRAFCEKMDAQGAVAFLETDQEKNVRLYERFGFEVTEHAVTVGVPMWFMQRAAP